MIKVRGNFDHASGIVPNFRGTKFSRIGIFKHYAGKKFESRVPLTDTWYSETILRSLFSLL